MTTLYSDDLIFATFPKAKKWEKAGKCRIYINGTDSIVKNKCFFENGMLVVPQIIYTGKSTFYCNGAEAKDKIYVSNKGDFEAEIVAELEAKQAEIDAAKVVEVVAESAKIGDFVEGKTFNGSKTAGKIVDISDKFYLLENGKKVPFANVTCHIPQKVVRVEEDRILYNNGVFISRNPFIQSCGRYIKRAVLMTQSINFALPISAEVFA